MNSPAAGKRQVGSPLRSQLGCSTCRRKKVKCDEQRPICGRCGRLSQACEWFGPEQHETPSKKRRRERETWTPPKTILPNVPSTSVAAGSSPQAQITVSGISTARDEGFSNLISITREDWFLNQGSNLDFNPRAADSLESISFENSINQDSSWFLHENFRFDFSHPIPSSLRHIWDNSNPILSLAGPLDLTSPSFQGNFIALSPDFKFTHHEHRALHHYQNFFSSGLTTKKNAAWTTYGAILSLASSDPMLMHLLIATSLIYLASCYGYEPNLLHAAQQHFKTGAQLLIKSLTQGGEPDHATALAAFYFTYCYMIKRKDMDTLALVQLSKAVLKHVERYDLDLYCAGTLPPEQGTSHNPEALTLSKNNRSFLARMIMWLYYKDAFACSMGYGGALASHMTAHGDRMRDIYQMSTTALESFWGDEYPATEVVDDVENAAAIEFLHEVWTCIQCMNEHYAQSEAKRHEKDEVEQRIAALQRKARPLFRLVAVITAPRSQLLQNADFAISYYYALLIFHYRHKLSFDNSIPPLPASVALTPLLNLAQRTFASEDSGHYERYVWPLFIAGIETEDAIHREWITGKIEDRRMRSALEQICLVQRRLGRRIEMKLVKRLLSGQEFPVMPLGETGDFGF